MKLKDIIRLTESRFAGSKVWHGTSREAGRSIVSDGIDVSKSESGYFGRGFYVADNPELAKSNYADFAEDGEEGVVLEFRVEPDARILDLRDEDDWKVWRDGGYDRDMGREDFPKRMFRAGIDGVYDNSFEGICFYNPDALRFIRVWSGVIDDPLIAGKTLDEVALGGLKRCTAVTLTALLQHFGKQGITIGEVPETEPGILAVLDKRGLAYRPFSAEFGHTVDQFVRSHARGAYYLVTEHHAMALVDGELVDAANKGPDNRKLLGVMQITRR
jgi:hypothetical protein